ncbi:MAG: HAD family hydrolase [Candidatus Omnitrophota bacterium]|nr:HAD family hydrolase [Candidatus Omnitrophota bacterium]
MKNLKNIQERIKLVIFDLDGTLVDAYEAITQSVNFTLKKLGYEEAPAKRIRLAVGWGDRKLLGAFIEEKDLNPALVIYRGHHRIALTKYTKLLSGAKELLEYLKQRDFKTAIASNRPTEFTHIILRCLDLRKYFDYVLCADKLPEGKPHPEILLRIMKKLKIKPEQVMYVGDMTIDVETARNAGVIAIAVGGGSSSLAEIKKAGPFKIIKSPASLMKIL